MGDPVVDQGRSGRPRQPVHALARALLFAGNAELIRQPYGGSLK
jgi:hypothetical protein